MITSPILKKKTELTVINFGLDIMNNNNLNKILWVLLKP